MSIKKITGMLFMIIGLLFAVLGAVRYIVFHAEKNELVYATAHIVRIDERRTGDPEFPVEYTAYVELEVSGEKITAELNTCDSGSEVDSRIDVYYYEKDAPDVQMVYARGSENFFVLFSLAGALFAAVGGVLAFGKSRQPV